MGQSYCHLPKMLAKLIREESPSKSKVPPIYELYKEWHRHEEPTVSYSIPSSAVTRSSTTFSSILASTQPTAYLRPQRSTNYKRWRILSQRSAHNTYSPYSIFRNEDVVGKGQQHRVPSSSSSSSVSSFWSPASAHPALVNPRSPSSLLLPSNRHL
jgi:hypothetical protein